MSKPMPMGKKLKDEERRIKKDGKLTFKGVEYTLEGMPEDEMTALTEALMLDSRALRRPLRE